jgi:hypothetical protein
MWYMHGEMHRHGSGLRVGWIGGRAEWSSIPNDEAGRADKGFMMERDQLRNRSGMPQEMAEVV